MSLIGSQAQHHYLTIIMMILFALLLVSCTNSLTQEDNDRLRLLQEEYGETVRFSADSELYLNVTSLRSYASIIPEDEAVKMYQTFFFGDNREMRKTAYQYLNVYDSKKAFQYQITYDPKTRQFMRTRSEHY